ncbi:uncharacterized protein TNCV_2521711 [Trichonephila clavipes]|nr:uncharacterized protein TNCV_2521711 [Trichonephila clavipes]
MSQTIISSQLFVHSSFSEGDNDSSRTVIKWHDELKMGDPAAREERRRRWVGFKGSTRNVRRDPKCPTTSHFCMVRENTRVPSEGVTYAWMAEDEAFGCTRAFLTIWGSSRRLVFRCPEPGLRVTDITQIHYYPHLLTTQ